MKICPKENHGCDIKLLWRMKQSKTDQYGGRKPDETFLKDNSRDAFSPAASIFHMLSLMEKQKEGEEENTPVTHSSQTQEEKRAS